MSWQERLEHKLDALTDKLEEIEHRLFIDNGRKSMQTIQNQHATNWRVVKWVLGIAVAIGIAYVSGVIK